MNSIVQQYFPIFREYQHIRSKLMETLANEDLSFSPGGENPTLGELCLEMGEVQQWYIDSFKQFVLNYTWRHDDRSIATSVDRLSVWFAELDEALAEAVSGLSEEEVQSKMIDRGGGFMLPPRIQLSVYQEALLIFYGKVMVYLKAMGKPRPAQMEQWIG